MPTRTERRMVVAAGVQAPYHVAQPVSQTGLAARLRWEQIMHGHDFNLFLSGVLLGASLPDGGIGIIGVLLAILNFVVYLRCIQRPLLPVHLHLHHEPHHAQKTNS